MNREKIADVLEKELPWRREDLLEFADKIIAIFPEQMTEEDIEARIFSECDKVSQEYQKRIEERYVPKTLIMSEEEIMKIIFDLAHALIGNIAKPESILKYVSEMGNASTEDKTK